MVAPAGDPGAAIFASLATAAPAGGWCAIIGKAPGSPVTADDVAKIAAVAAQAVRSSPTFGIVDPFGMWAQVTAAAVTASLQPWVAEARPCDTIPNNLTEVPGVKERIPGSQGAGPLIGNLIDWTGLGDVFVKGAILVGIIVLFVAAIRRVLE